MQVRSAALGLLALTLHLGSGCAGTEEHALSFAPGQHSAKVRDVRVDVSQARYSAQYLTVRCTVHNDTADVLTIGRDGILLEDDGLEHPPRISGLPDAFDVNPGQAADLEFTFPINALEPRERTLGLWELRHHDQAVPPLRVDVPGIRTEPAPD